MKFRKCLIVTLIICIGLRQRSFAVLICYNLYFFSLRQSKFFVAAGVMSIK